MQPHLKKCFEALVKLDFQEDKKIVGLFSAHKERIPFVTGFYPEGGPSNQSPLSSSSSSQLPGTCSSLPLWLGARMWRVNLPWGVESIPSPC